MGQIVVQIILYFESEKSKRENAHENASRILEKKKKLFMLQVCDELCVGVCVRVMTAHIKRGLKIYVQEFYNLIACC